MPTATNPALTQWRAGFPITTIEDKQVQIVQGTAAGGTRVKLFFDVESGLLTRVGQYTNTRIGIVPTQVDYSNYREVAGIRMPFRLTITWTGGQSSIELSEIQPNVPIDDVKFAQPAPAVVKQAAK